MDKIIRSLCSWQDTSLFLLLVSIVITFILITQKQSRKSKKFSCLMEKIAVLLFLFCTTRVSLSPFYHFSPEFLIIPPQNTCLTSLQPLIYLVLTVATGGRLISVAAKRGFHDLVISFLGNPFIWLLTVLCLLSAFWTSTPLFSAKAGLVLIGMNIISVYIARVFTSEELFSFFRIHILIVAILSLILGNSGGADLSGILISKNQLGNLMALGSVLWIANSIFNPKMRWLSLSTSSLLLLTMLRANSAGAISNFAILMTTLLLTRFLKLLPPRQLLLVVNFFIIASFGIYFILSTNLEKIFNLLGKDMTLTGRTGLWSEIWELASNKFWLGYGSYGFWQHWRGLDSPASQINLYWSAPNAHQGFLDIFVELGMVGLVVLLISILINLSNAIVLFVKTKNKRESVLILVLLLYVIISNFGESFFIRPNFVWLSYLILTMKLSLMQVKINRVSSMNENAVLNL